MMTTQTTYPLKEGNWRKFSYKYVLKKFKM